MSTDFSVFAVTVTLNVHHHSRIHFVITIIYFTHTYTIYHVNVISFIILTSYHVVVCKQLVTQIM